MYDFFTTDVTVTVRVTTQLGAGSAVQLVQTQLQVPAVKQVTIMGVTSNESPGHGPPMSEMKPFKYVGGYWKLA